MRTMTAVEAKNSFGKFLEATHREPVSVTKNNREIAALFSMEDLRSLAESFLAEPLKAEVADGSKTLVEAIMAQGQINKRLDERRRSIAEGKGIVADSAYFDGLVAHAQARLS